MRLPAALVGRRGIPVDRLYLPRAYDFTCGQGRRSAWLIGCPTPPPNVREPSNANPALPRASHRVQLPRPFKISYLPIHFMTKPMTKSELARQLGTTRHNILYHTRTGNAPKDLNDVEAWQIYMISVGREGTIPKEMREAMSKEKLAILKAVRYDKERTNRRKDDELCPVAFTTQYMRDMIDFCFIPELDRLVKELPSILKGMDEVAIFEEMNRQAGLIRQALQARLNQVDKQQGDNKQQKG